MFFERLSVLFFTLNVKFNKCCIFGTIGCYARLGLGYVYLVDQIESCVRGLLVH